MKSTFFTILVVVLLSAISGVYFYRSLFQKSAEYGAAPTNSALQLINRLQKIKIDRTFFDDPDYRSLQLYPQESLDGIEKGRLNPYVGKVRPLFAPDPPSKNPDSKVRTGADGKGAANIKGDPFIE